MDRCTEFTFGVPWVMGFFHRDWALDAPTEAEAVAGQFVEELEPEAVLLVRRDARLLHDALPADRVTVLWEGCVEGGERFFRRGRLTDGAAWMRQLTGVCDRWLARRPDPVTLSGADRYDGPELAGRARAAVEEFDGVLDEEVVRALTECVDRCTPDLAFRLLLRALPVRSDALSPGYLCLSTERYARLAELGAAFRYGEYVVGDVAHLVDA
ncbi:hypothetical protein [Streptomyces sp. HB132]|uniref:hypothetical protein n=1 Tax=Streptomyces sp. HB132 TaxID=767388 RepID=UPI001961D2E6|nr:hypothetical protein [Streptomyces sp. HB132]MBM7441402.1 hypothetical protein [Streptomyces sp. HB132]